MPTPMLRKLSNQNKYALMLTGEKQNFNVISRIAGTICSVSMLIDVPFLWGAN